MAVSQPNGYAGRVLRVDLTAGRVSDLVFDEATRRKWVGGSGLGSKILYDEVPPSANWSDPENRLIMATGPLAGTRVAGSGTFSAVTVGAMTNGSTTTQANGYLGAYMKFSGFDGIVLQGKAENWVYLYLHDGVAELRDASNLLGLDTWELQETLEKELGKKEHEISVFGIGPAGERLVRFAAIAGDRGHVASHNGVGAVMGSKRVKAVVAARGPRVGVADDGAMAVLTKKLLDAILSNPVGRNSYEWGTSQNYLGAAKGGWLPVKNYTTSLFPAAADFMGDKYRPAFQARPAPCYACHFKHLHMLTIPDGPYAGFHGEEPEYEQWAAWGGQIGNTDVAGAVVLSNDVDRLGIDTNESGWIIGWLMECFESGTFTAEDLDGIPMTWGNVESTRKMLRKIAYREGIGDVLAEGVRLASERMGKGSQEAAIYTMRGNTPRGHDHRSRWLEMLDTCVSDTGTITIGPPTKPEEQGAPPAAASHNAQQATEIAGKHAGRMVFEDCLGTCRFTTRAELAIIAEIVAAATGWDFSYEEAMVVGRRTINLLRAFNLRRGIGPTMDYPSKRYSSTPVDGPGEGKSILPHWEEMRAGYYELMGWDLESGKPLPVTLQNLGLPEVARELWG